MVFNKMLEQLERLIAKYVELKKDIEVTKEISKGLESEVEELYDKISIILQRISSLEAKFEGLDEKIWLKLENKYLRQKETGRLELEDKLEDK